jgi:endoglucanase
MRPPAQTQLPRWRGFNLLEAFTMKSPGDFREEDLEWIADWGFNWVRLPMCYTLWTHDQDPTKLNEAWLEHIDRAIECARKKGLHVCLNFHRAPGYSVNQERKEPYNLWKDASACETFCAHWRVFAKRYGRIPSRELSFNLVNEPGAIDAAAMSRADHERVVRAAVAAIRDVDSERLIIADGMGWGNIPSLELADLEIAQSCRGYAPFGLTHFKANWVDSKGWPEPEWPGKDRGGEHWDRKRLEKHYAPWIELARHGVGVHCGEAGAFNHTPHPVVLGWLRDLLTVLKKANIGFALWNFRGAFGVLDSGRQDVTYKDWNGHKLDRKMLELLQEF